MPDQSIAEAFVRIRAMADPNFQQEASSQITPSVARIAGDAAAVWAAAKVFKVGKEGLDELKEAEVANAQLSAAIKATGGAAGVSADQVDKMSQAALKQAGVDDEAAKAAATLLLRFGDIKNTDADKTFDRANQAALDLSKAMGTDLTSAAKVVGIALADPEAGMNRLRRAGVILTDQQKEQIKTFQDSGDIQKAQGVILDALNAKVGGAAAAYGETLAGKVDIANESLKNAKAEMVAGAAPALSFMAEGVTFLSDKFEALPEPVQTVVGGLGLLTAGVGSLVRPVKDAVQLLEAWRAAHQVAAIATDADTAALAANTAAVDAQVASTAAAAATTETYVATATKAEIADVRRIVSNETGAAAIKANAAAEAELSAMLEARQVAATQALLGNAALIESEVELDAALVANTVALEANIAAQEEAAAASAATATRSGGLASTLGKAGIAGAAVAGSFALYEYGQSLNKTTLSTEDLRRVTALSVGDQKRVFDQLEALAKGGGAFGGMLDDAIAKLKDSGAAGVGTLKQLRDQYAAAGQDTSKFDAALKDAKVSHDAENQATQTGTAALGDNTDALDANAGAATKAKDPHVNLQKVYQGDAEETQKATDALSRYSDGLHAFSDPAFAMVDAQKSLIKAQDDAKKSNEAVWYAQVAYTNAVKEHGSKSAEANLLQAALNQTLADADDKTEAVAKSAFDLNTKAADLAGQLRLHPELWSSITATMQGFVDQGLITQAQADAVTGSLQGNIDRADALQGRQVSFAVGVDATSANAALDEIQARIAQATTGISGIGGAYELQQQQLAQFYAAQQGHAAGGPVRAGETFTGAEAGPELLVLPQYGSYRAPANGYVVPADQTAALLSKKQGGDHTTVNVYNPVPEPAGESVHRELRRVEILARRS